jgi:hypothetical protein
LAYCAEARAVFADLLHQKGTYLQGRGRSGGVVEKLDGHPDAILDKIASAAEQDRAGQGLGRAFCATVIRSGISSSRESLPGRSMTIAIAWSMRFSVVGDWQTNGEHDRNDAVGLRRCRVSYCDLNGVEHSVEVSAESLYEAVAQGLRVFRENDWIDQVGHGQTTISVAVTHPEVQHKVRIQDFERWLESQGRTPAEMSLKARLRELLAEVTPVASRTTRDRR